jgi:uncharacterized protein YdiU (UPF0061 family)
MPLSPAYRPDPRYTALGPEFADAVAPAVFPERRLRFRNQDWAARIGLDGLSAAEWEAAFARFEPLADNMKTPLAMRYHGHQFGVYNPDLGDGRGFLFAQVRDDAGRLLDLATKGSGQTPYSRAGDGRLTLKGGVREILAAQMLEAQGVYTSKPLALFETGERLQRNDEPSPTRASVLTRLGHSHIRFGTFQRLAFFERADLMRTLIDHCAECYHRGALEEEGEARAAAVYEAVVRASARLAASWMAAGFVHGVLNTDNMTITGESFDYGPWRFLPTSQPGFTAAYFDEAGRYAFARQPEVVAWNLAQLGGALTLICEAGPLNAALRSYPALYRDALGAAVCARLGVARAADAAQDERFLGALFSWLTDAEIGWAQFFHDWFAGAASTGRAAKSPAAHHYDADSFAPIRSALEARAPIRPERLAHPVFARPTPATLLIDDVEGLWAPIAEDDDWSAFEGKLGDIAALGAALDLDGSRARPDVTTSASRRV